MPRIIIDVREPAEYAQGHVEGALNLSPAQLMAGAPELTEIPKETELVLYCRSGSRSQVAAHILTSYGFKNIKNGINKETVEKLYGPAV